MTFDLARGWVLATAVAALACSTSPQTSADAATDAASDAGPIGGDRPVPLVKTPEAWDGKKPLPLLIVIHGYGVGGWAEALYFNVLPLVDEKQIVIAAPDGLVDSAGKRYWNAVDTCCDFDGRGEDDVAYLAGLVTDIASRYPIDLARVYLLGHSNGGAMAMRLACDRAPTFAAVFELAGPFWSNPAQRCAPAAPIALRVLHGTADTEVPYDGDAGDAGISGPSAPSIAAFFASKDGCGPTPDTTAPPLDLDTSIPGAETTVTRYTGCAPGSDVELWSIQGGAHIPDLSPSFRETVWSFLSAHAR